jgi:hypothetical protein
MTVSMLITNKVTGEVITDVPVSFQTVYNTRWVPLAEKLGLKTVLYYVGLSGIIARQGETEPIISDLRTLKDYLMQNRDEPYAEYMMTNIDRLIPYLEEIEANSDLEGSFG